MIKLIKNLHLLKKTDPWTTGAGYSVRPVTAVIKTKHAGLNPVVLGSVSFKNRYLDS